ncbi:class I SAM-dependent methyltransferase [Corticibacterium sp. UT-5YL-CI-8]|nr:class I SAM-dependent methyltransferase [Tianweitania sp. UT-5YL-CI-8]
MSGFDKGWLTLREPVDQAARSPTLLSALSYHLAAVKSPRALLDIGCGTGSTWRSLHAFLPKDIEWRLLDYDPELLAEAKRRIGAQARVRFHRHDLNDLDGLPLDGIAVVTASAFFDLCSESFCRRLVARLRDVRSGLYAALTYDGHMQWSVPHLLDPMAVEDFNLHQRSDKGLGAALGPDATATLRSLFEEAGFRIQIAESPWRMGQGYAPMQEAFLQGFVQPLTEIGRLSEAEIKEWLAFRIDAIAKPESSCVVGHLDLLALPG